MFREDIAFTDTPSRKCTSNDQPWTTARICRLRRSPLAPGNYSGNSSSRPTFLRTGWRPERAGHLDPRGSYPAVNCAGGGSYYTPFTILTTTIKPDCTFTAKVSQSGVVGGSMRRWTYSVTGCFQGPDSTGAATAAGVYREDIVFTDTPSRRCTSNDLSWAATRTG